jgi:hypothetical protein
LAISSSERSPDHAQGSRFAQRRRQRLQQLDDTGMEADQLLRALEVGLAEGRRVKPNPERFLISRTDWPSARPPSSTSSSCRRWLTNGSACCFSAPPVTATFSTAT